MAPRRIALVLLAAILLGIAAWYFQWAKRIAPSARSLRPAPTLSTSAAVAAPAARPIENRESKIENPLAAELNAPTGTIRRDLAVLNELFTNFQTNFPRTGNPVGENAEITAALTGDNPAQFAFIPKNHPAINARGELCDRWGTPFHFHQLSGQIMEIRSAGPDRKFGTADDAELSPPSPIAIPR
jgi:hypothetical protein